MIIGGISEMLMLVVMLILGRKIDEMQEHDGLEQIASCGTGLRRLEGPWGGFIACIPGTIALAKPCLLLVRTRALSVETSFTA